MKEIFRFWGYPPRVWHEMIGPQGSIQIEGRAPLETKFGQLRFTQEGLDLLGDFRKEVGEGIPAYIRLGGQGETKGKAVVRLEVDPSSEPVPLVTVDSSGRYHFYLDLDETVSFIQQEKYVKHDSPFYVKWGLSPDRFPSFLRKAAFSFFGLTRSLLAARSGRFSFPKSSKDISVDIWRFFIRALIERHPGMKEASLPLWPNSKQYAVILNHDVDTAWGFENEQGINVFRKIEEEHGLRSAWMVVGNLAGRGESCLRDLSAAGHEIGFHGPDHDHTLAYLPEEEIRERLSRFSGFLKDFDCYGFRSPSYHRTKTLYRALDPFIRYDMSMHDTFENVNSPLPSYGGCSTCFPFRIEDTKILEIPMTVMEDFVLEMKGELPARALECQLGLIERIKQRQGVVNLLTHAEPQLTARSAWTQNYDTLLREIVKSPSAWLTLPRDLYRWWDQRERQIKQQWDLGHP